MHHSENVLFAENFWTEIIFHPNIMWGEVIHPMCGKSLLAKQPVWDQVVHGYSVGLFDHMKMSFLNLEQNIWCAMFILE